MIIPVFDTKIAVYQFDRMREFGPGTPYSKIVDSYFNHPLFANVKAPEQVGKAITTFNMDYQVPLIDGLGLRNELGQWIIARTLDAAHELDLAGTSTITGFKLVRGWANRLYQGTSGKVHQHLNNCHFVCIFYYEAPEHSSDLVFINEYDVEKIGDVDDMPPEKLHRITPKPGMMVCHDPLIPHAITAHGNDAVRTCFVFEIEYVVADKTANQK